MTSSAEARIGFGEMLFFSWLGISIAATTVFYSFFLFFCYTLTHSTASANCYPVIVAQSFLQ